GNLAAKVKSVFHAVAKPVNRVIDKIVGFIIKAGKKIWAKLKSTFGGKNKPGSKKDAEDDKKDNPKSRDVKRKAHELLVGRTSSPVASVEALESTVHQVFTQLRPEGLKSLRLKPVEGGGRRYSVLATASPEESVLETSVVYSGEDYRDIMRSAIPRGGIISFLHGVASGEPKTVKFKGAEVKVDFAFFEEAWNATQLVVDLVKDRFRAAMNAHHEWIPSNFILEVMKRARQAAADGEAWIDLQHELRNETFRVVFAPGKSRKVEKDSVNGSPEKDYTVLQGHSGAVYWKKEEQTVGQADFHNALRDAFTASTTPSGAVAGALKVAKEWVWDGGGMTPGMHPDLFNKKNGGTRITAEYQRGNLAKIMERFESLARRVS
ncbi:hypothetical protein, partial [Streptomyces sp. NPDC020983]|uniref:hypothetical protein n=1 Tax=Streptomyces sp. NPDC020983 TaxID=3365106 RepID=UPI00378D5E34